MAGDAFEYEDEERGVGSNGFGPNGKVTYASTGGTTPNRSSGGFTNVGQLLRLNRQSGQDSARQLNSDVASQADKARQGLGDSEKSFNESVDKASGALQPGATMDQAKAALGQGPYAGPKGLDDVNGFGQVRQNVQAASDRVGNLNTAEGRAAEAARAQSLSGRQAAASSFYMGSSNPMFKQTVNKFGNLNQMMTDASKRAQNYAGQGIANIDANKVAAQNRINQLNQQAADQARANEMARREADRKAADATGNTKYGVDSRRNMDETQMAAAMGMSLDEWIKRGRPWGNDAWNESHRTGGL